MAEREARIELRVEALQKTLKGLRKVSTELDDTADAVDDVGDETKDAAKETESFSDTWTELKSKVDLFVQAARAGFTALKKVGHDLPASILQTAGAAELAERGFRTLAGGADEAQSLLSKLREETMGLIPDTELMRSANQALSSDLAITKDQLAEATGAAVRLSRAYGMPLEEAISGLNASLSRQTFELLERLNISGTLIRRQVQERKAQAEAAGTLDEFNEKAVLQTLIVDTLAKREAKLSEETSVASDAYTRFVTSLINFRDDFTEAVTESEKMQDAFSRLSKAIGGLSVDKLANDLQKIIDLLADIIEKARGAVSGLQAVGETAGFLESEQTPEGQAVQAVGMGTEFLRSAGAVGSTPLDFSIDVATAPLNFALGNALPFFGGPDLSFDASRFGELFDLQARTIGELTTNAVQEIAAITGYNGLASPEAAQSLELLKQQRQREENRQLNQR